MKFLITLLVVIIFIISRSFAFNEEWQFISELKVGKRPSQVLILQDTYVLVFCAGWDANQNGIQDEGDEPASIWYFWTENGQITTFQSMPDYTNPKKLIDLDFRNEELPLSPVLLREKNEIYLPGPNGVTEITIDYGSSYHEITAKKEIILPQIPVAISTGKSKTGSDRLYLSIRDKEKNTGSILVYDLVDKIFYDTIPAYANVQKSLPVNYDRELFILNSDTLSSESKLLVVHVGENIGLGKHLLLKDMSIPSGANHLTGNSSVYITSCKNSNLTIIDKDYNLNTSKINLPKNGGPREIADGSAWMSAYNGYVYRFSQNGENVQFSDSLKAYGKAEGLALSWNFFIIATPYQEGSFEPDTSITLYGKELVSVEENINVSIPAIYPNPADNYITIDKSIIIGEAKIFSFTGEKIFSSDNSQVDISNLSSGVYFIKAGNKYYSFIKR